MAFIGLPCPANITGMREVGVLGMRTPYSRKAISAALKALFFLPG